MSKFVALNMVEVGPGVYNEDTGQTDVTETTKPVAINTDNVRAFYARRDGKPGTRLTFTDGGGFAVSESPDQVALAVAGGELAAHLAFAIQPPASETVS